MSDPKYEIYDGQVVFANAHVGAVLLPDETWYPFAYLSDGNIDIWDTDGGFLKPSSAYKMAKMRFT